MHHRVVQVTKPAHLCLQHKSLRVRLENQDEALIPFEDLGVLILDGPEITLTAPLLAVLAESNIAVIFTAANHMPCGVLQPLSGHNLHAETLGLQIQCSRPKAKRVWQQIVQAKINHQADLLRYLKRPSPKLAGLAAQVGSGDPENREGQAAALYFPRVFGNDFYRDRGRPGTNAMLNYGYAVLRALVARALTGAGLHPALGIHHHNRYNPYALADDAMEPLRPLVDALVANYLSREEEPETLTPAIKRYLVKVSVLPVIFAENERNMLDALELYAASLRRGICEEARKINLPRPIWSAVTE